MHRDRAADSVTALVATIALTVTVPVRVIAARVVGIRVIEGRQKFFTLRREGAKKTHDSKMF